MKYKIEYQDYNPEDEPFFEDLETERLERRKREKFRDTEPGNRAKSKQWQKKRRRPEQNEGWFS